MVNFDYHSITIGRSKVTNQVIVKGEITNCSGRSFNAVAVRIILFIKNTAIANTIIMINGLVNGSTKSFEKAIEELEYDQVGKDITRHEIYTDSCY